MNPFHLDLRRRDRVGEGESSSGPDKTWPVVGGRGLLLASSIRCECPSQVFLACSEPTDEQREVGRASDADGSKDRTARVGGRGQDESKSPQSAHSTAVQLHHRVVTVAVGANPPQCLPTRLSLLLLTLISPA